MADRLIVSDLDFDLIKENLKAFLKQKPEFTDYDFEGSGLNVLIDALAYNTHYQAYYLNMIANESFLDTAQLRDSVVSHAKAIGYTPFSKKAPMATINFTVKSSSNTYGKLTIPRGYSFLSNQIDGKAYKFIVMDDTSVTKSNTIYYFENLNIYEGQLINYSYIQDNLSNPKQIFNIPDSSVDISTLRVSVSPSVGNTYITAHSLVDDITDVTSDSTVYFLQEERNGKYQIYFGNGVIGRKVPDGGVVRLSYLVTNGSAANKANNFIGTNALVDITSESISNFTVNPVFEASGGSDRESVDSIKFSAPLSYASQNRLVTYRDYEVYIKRQYHNIDSISVWGGESETPPVYGKVFISIKPKAGFYLSQTEKDKILETVIRPKSMVTIRPEIINPNYLYLTITTNVKYDPTKTTLTSEQLKSQIRSAISLYNMTYLNKFDSRFVLSKVQESINYVDTNVIIGCNSVIKSQRKFLPDIGILTTYDINFNIPVMPGTAASRLNSSDFWVYDNYGIKRKVVFEEVPNSFTGITSIDVNDPGAGFTSAPTVRITGDGKGATAEAIIVNNRIERIDVLTAGIDYSKATATLSGGGGYGAVITPVVGSNMGIIRTVYYNNLGDKKIVDPNIGSINYSTGEIHINEINIVQVDSSDGMIKIECPVMSGIVQSEKNSILTIDETDPYSIIINLESI